MDLVFERSSQAVVTDSMAVNVRRKTRSFYSYSAVDQPLSLVLGRVECKETSSMTDGFLEDIKSLPCPRGCTGLDRDQGSKQLTRFICKMAVISYICVFPTLSEH